MTMDHTGPEAADYPPLRVHVVADSSTPPAARPRGLRSTFHTVTLTADEFAQEILPASDNRVIARVQPYETDIVISDNKADAKAGFGAVIPRAATATTTPYPVQHNGPVYAGSVSATGVPGLSSPSICRVAVTAVYRA